MRHPFSWLLFTVMPEEHKRAVMKADSNNAIAEHVRSTGHKIQWDETTSIDHDGDWFRRRVKEALYIRSSNAMKSDPGLSLNPCWTAPRSAPCNNDRHCCGYDNNFNSLTLNSIFNFIQPHHVLSHVHYPYLFCCASHLA